ncbi:MAG: 30S ribosomal protein S6 [Chitinispirillia bacterium]|nr:30S ribosomal protein S6 [Chitinispirillia bacterium]MCL2241432.1 30S ribosomal protein S6 [Chitinispirillia bacterium]
MIRPYETAVVIDGTLADDAIQREQQQLEDFFKANAEFENADVWGKRPLAYTIKKKKIGYYVIFNYKSEGGVPAAFEKHVKLNENVLRHLTVVRDLKNEEARAAFAVRKEKVELERAEGADDGDDMDRDDRDDRDER